MIINFAKKQFPVFIYTLLFLIVITPCKQLGGSKVKPSELIKRMIILMDEKDESPSSSLSAVTSVFASNIRQKAAPMVVSLRLIDSYLEKRRNPEIYSRGMSDALITNAKLDFTQWNIDYLKESPFMLFCPKTMAPMIQQEQIIQIPMQEKMAATVVLKSIKFENFDHFIPTGNDPESELLSLVNKKMQEKTILKSTNDFTKISTQPIIIDDFKKAFFNKEDIIKQLKSSLSGANKNQLEEAVAYATSFLGSWNFFIMGHGLPQKTIAGLPIAQFQQFLAFLNTITTKLATISSCYSGGVNLDSLQLKNYLQKNKVPPHINYLLAVVSTTDAPTKDSPKLGDNLNKFFDNLETTGNPDYLTHALFNLATGVTDRLVKQNIPQVLIPNGSWFQVFQPKKTGTTPALQAASSIAILSSVLVKKYTIEESITKARLDKLQKQEKLSAKDKNTISQLEKILKTTSKGIVIEGNAIQCILVYPSIVPVPVIIKSSAMPSCISMQQGNSAHIFSTINFEPKNIGYAGVFNFAEKAFTPEERETKVTYLIRKLTGANDVKHVSGAHEQFKKIFAQGAKSITLQNVVIREWAYKNHINIEIHFQYNGTYWLMSSNDHKPLDLKQSVACEWNNIEDDAIILDLLKKEDLFSPERLQVLQAIASGDNNLVKSLLEKNILLDTTGILYAAMHSGNLEIVKFLVEKGEKVTESMLDMPHLPQPVQEFLKEQYTKKSTALQKLIPKIEQPIKKPVMEEQAKPEVKKASSEQLVHAFIVRDLDKAKQLIEQGADINAPDKNGNTPLNYALRSRQSPPELVKLLIERGANVNAKDMFGIPLLYSAMTEYPPENQQLLVNAGANVNAQAHGKPLLYYAIQQRNPELIGLFLDHGADINAQVDGEPLLYWATHGTSHWPEDKVLEAVTMLVNKGMKISNSDIESVPSYYPKVKQLLQEHMSK